MIEIFLFCIEYLFIKEIEFYNIACKNIDKSRWIFTHIFKPRFVIRNSAFLKILVFIVLKLLNKHDFIYFKIYLVIKTSKYKCNITKYNVGTSTLSKLDVLIKYAHF